ncbi:MAG: hypothetical protein KDA79_13460 [Planctomycetaceae bacterium]|nr:hypothetical protein [Planctomycetaceae bacterium]
MAADLADALTAIARRMAELATRDASLNAELRVLAEGLLEALAETGQADAARPDESPAVAQDEQPARPVPTAAESPPQSDTKPASREPAPREEEVEEEPERVPLSSLPPLTLGQARPVPAEPPSTSWPAHWMDSTEADLALVENRCRLKSEACRWAATRRRLLAEAADFTTEIAPRDQQMISRARDLTDCYLWMCHPSGPSPADPREYDEMAGCFETLADAVSLMRQVLEERELHANEFEVSLDLLAEAQSTVRAAVSAMDGGIDTDQSQIYNWLRTTTREEHVYIQRYMRADDPADPANRGNLAARIEAVDSRLQEQRRQVRSRRKLLGKVRHKVSLLNEEPEQSDHLWNAIVQTVDELVSDGMPPSNRELRELLAPVIDDIPEMEEVPAGFDLVLREIDRFLASCPPQERNTTATVSPEVQEVARLLKGRSVVLIGGDRRPGAAESLKSAFQLDELYWIETREHQSIDGFAPYVARSDVAVVILAIRWTSHSFGDVKNFCETHNKPLVRLPAGYSPNMIAAHIMGQCSDRLEQSR